MYHYVVVGAGSAGCVLAARLSEDPGTRVLLIEAGPADDADEFRVPAAFPTFFKGPFDWDYTAAVQHRDGRGVHWPRGRVLGGSSSINGTIYVRGNRLDYDTWRDDYGCDGWGYADLLPYFLRAENHQHGPSAYHGTGGPLHVQDLPYRHPLSVDWVAAATASGLPANDDFNGAEQDGVGFYQVTQRSGRRWSTAAGYLRPATTRDNLVVETGALVTKIVIENDRAVGVRYMRNGSEREVRAGREVVLSGGAVNSPQLLMLSGIGPAEHLRDVGISPIVDAPAVGRGLQDHPTCVPVWRTPETRNHWEEAAKTENWMLWQQQGQGPMTSPGGEAGAFIRTRTDLPAPDLQYGPVSAPIVLDPEVGIVEPTWRGASLLVFAIEVRSRGRISLRSSDPRDKPLIDPAYLADDADLNVLAAGIKQAREIAAHQPLASHIADEFTPGESMDDDEQLRAWIRANVGTAMHPTSSCAMGGAADAVCDPSLRVRGVDGLRVVDASVMPAIPRGNINAPTIAIAERAADLIRGNTTG